MTQGLGGRPVENAKHTAVAHIWSLTPAGALMRPIHDLLPAIGTHTQQIHIFRHKHSKPHKQKVSPKKDTKFSNEKEMDKRDIKQI